MMKQVRFTLLFLIGSLVFLQPTHSAIMTKVETTQVIEKQKNELKKEFKVQKKMNKLQKFFKKLKIDLSDPTEKWMWFWIFGWGAGLVLSILSWSVITSTGFGIFWLLASLCWLFGSVSLVIWLVKKFS